ncbi:hypothetical protein E2320_000496 [Naja naja]|nr:hypothetical protein E2320_000496 [Naja naja]
MYMESHFCSLIKKYHTHTPLIPFKSESLFHLVKCEITLPFCTEDKLYFAFCLLIVSKQRVIFILKNTELWNLDLCFI